MKKTILITVIVGVLALLIGYFAGIFFPTNLGTRKSISFSSKSPEMKSEIDSFSYFYGISIGQFLQNDLKNLKIEEEFSSRKFINGMVTGIEGDEDQGPDQMTMQRFMQVFFMKKQAEMQAESDLEASANLEEGTAFLENNKKQAGVFTTTSGLQYQIITSGSGNFSPRDVDTVIVHYKGTLLDGTVFDSSIDRGQPAKFKLNEVIKGWTEGLQLMKIGDKWKFFIPSDLAYGSQQTGETIGPNSTLIFEVELLDIIEAK